MPILEVELTEPLKEFIDEQVSHGAYTTPSAYVTALLDQARKQATKAKLEKSVLEGLASGAPIEATPEYWEQKRRSFDERFGHHQDAS